MIALLSKSIKCSSIIYFLLFSGVFSDLFSASLANTKPNMLFQSEQTRIHFSNLKTDDGLSHPVIDAIEQDNQGYIWFGTNDGLNRYDGVKMRHYNSLQGGTGSLAGDWVFDIHSDKKGRLWVATKGGINLYLPNKDGFKVFTKNQQYPELLDQDFTVIAEAADEIMWFGGRSHVLTRYDPKLDKFDTVSINEPQNVGGIADLLVDSQQRLWIATGSGGLILAPDTGGDFQHFTTSSQFKIPTNKLNALFEDDLGRLWVGTNNSGVFVFDLKSGVSQHFRSDKNNSNSLCSDYVTDFHQDGFGRIWLSTDNGLCEYQQENNVFVRHQNESLRLNSLLDNRVNRLFQDAGGVIWAGTMTGLSRWNAKLEPFSHISNKFGLGKDLVSNVVTSFAQDKNDNLYVGTWGGGVSRIHPVTNEIYTELVNDSKPFGLLDNNVMSLLADSNDNLWVGTQTQGLFLRENGQEDFKVFQSSKTDFESISSNAISKIIELKDGRIIIGTFGGGVNVYQSGGKFSQLKHSQTEVNSLSNNNVLDIVEGNNADLWIATSGGGLNNYSFEDKQFSRYLKDKTDPSAIGSNYIYSLLNTGTNLWLATEDNGLARLSLDELENGSVYFEKISRRDGLLSNMVYGLIEDENANIWFSHSKGLSRLSPKDMSVMNFNTTHGLQDNDFNSGAYFKARNGQIFFGGHNGFNTFMPDQVPINQYDTPVQLTEFSVFNQAVPFHQAFNDKGIIELTYSDSVIGFTFAALDYTKPSANQYQYKMEGIHDKWVSSDNKNHITFSNLSHGKYTFKVKGTNSDGIWGGNPLTISITVLPPPWKTWWAYTLYCLIFIILIWSFMRAQRKKLKIIQMVNEQLESKVLERTKELQLANQKSEELSFTDQLTGLKNRHFLLGHLKADIDIILRNQHNPSENSHAMVSKNNNLIFFIIDIDYFKHVNDVHGHTAGDAVLIQIKTVLESVFRESDYMVRWGGEEFLVIARYAERNNAPILAEKLRQSVEAFKFDIGNGYFLKKTCSIGFAFFPFLVEKPDLLSWERVVDIADHCLFSAKKSGRNAWVGFEDINCDEDNLFTNLTGKTKYLAIDKKLNVMSSLDNIDDITWH